MLRIVLMVLRNLPFVPYWWWQLCHTAKNPEAYSEQERWVLLQKITTHANKGGRVIIESRNTEIYRNRNPLCFSQITRGCTMYWP